MKASLYLTILLLIVSISAPAQDYIEKEIPDSLVKSRLRTVIIAESAFYVLGNAYLQFVWYRDDESVPFHFYNDNAGWLQIDKAAHAYIAYYESYAGYNALRWAGVSEKKALIWGGSLGLILQTPIEIFDGIYEGFGFSWGDMIANAFGSALFTTQQAIWKEQIVKMKFSYSPSPYNNLVPGKLGENEIESFFVDYNGHTYWFSTAVNRILPINTPDWLSIAVGYSGNGMLDDFENPRFYRGRILPPTERYRQYLFSVDVDFSKVKTRSRFMRGLLDKLNLIKVPAPALEYNRLDGMKVRWFYF